MKDTTASMSLPDRLRQIIATLKHGLVERDEAVRLVLLAALAGEHSLLIGPPGTAKSELARRLHRVFEEAPYFERLLTRFSVPEELFGPLSISALEQDRYERQTRGFLPEASIAFIDEVFKANSAILNALLTLLNEREFDNGAGRQRCPLVSVVGATNEVPDDEVAEAFFDRFLVRLTVAPVSNEGFMDLLSLPAALETPRIDAPLSEADRSALTKAADAVVMPAEVSELLVELRDFLSARETAVSDRRWVKIVWLMKTAAACEGRAQVVLWDLCLLPACLASDAETQVEISDWLTTRLGVQAAFLPERVTRAVEAFEAQVMLEQRANDLDFDESGRLRFSPDVVTEDIAEGIAGAIGDAKGGAGATRMTYQRKRRYGQIHIDARTGQIDDLMQRLAAYRETLQACIASLAQFDAQALWMSRAFADAARTHLEGTGEALAQLEARLGQARRGFEALPRLDADPGTVPDPVRFD